MSLHLEQLVLEVKQVAIEAGHFLRQERARFDRSAVQEKGPHDYVSYVDKASEERLVAQLSSLLPEAGFITEEKTTRQCATEEYCWVIDPLDGTTNFIHDMGVEYVSVHYEACNHLHRSLQNIQSMGMKAGVAINPHTPVSNLEYILEYADFVLIMSVNPGFGGQSFIENSLRKISELKEMITRKGLNTLIEVDGGVSLKNAAALKEAVADIIVVGSAITSSPDPIKTITELKAI